MDYSTKQSELIIDLLKSVGGAHLTADDITSRLSASNSPVGKTTVYRQLDKLTERGLVRKFTSSDRKSACYQYVGDGCRNHYHLKCRACGELAHLECGHLDTVAAHILSKHGFALNEEMTVLYGLCRDCRPCPGGNE
ncbi:MAG: transcriptional repressor [Oscillospiraceae bacterium]|nr:transcriptional repressor [Oscillospiraceae bacterium]